MTFAAAERQRTQQQQPQQEQEYALSSCRYCTCVFTRQRELIKAAVSWGCYLEQKPLIALIKDLCHTPESQNNNVKQAKMGVKKKKITTHQPGPWVAVRPANHGGRVVGS